MNTGRLKWAQTGPPCSCMALEARGAHAWRFWKVHMLTSGSHIYPIYGYVVTDALLTLAGCASCCWRLCMVGVMVCWQPGTRVVAPGKRWPAGHDQCPSWGEGTQCLIGNLRWCTRRDCGWSLIRERGFWSDAFPLHLYKRHAQVHLVSVKPSTPAALDCA